jgi:hypothetical protein
MPRSKKQFKPTISVLWRVVLDDTERWFGVATVEELSDLFWQIDEHIDPSDVEIAEIHQHSLCWHEVGAYRPFDDDSEEDGEYPEIAEGSLELSSLYDKRYDADTQWYKLKDLVTA